MTTKKDDFLYGDLTYQIRGAIFEVWKELGPAFKETAYQDALEEEFKRRNIPNEKEKSMPIYYKGKKIGTYKPDFLVGKAVIVEIKVLPYLTLREEKQLWYYVKGSEYKVAPLVNFGGQRLQIRRWIYDKAREKLQ